MLPSQWNHSLNFNFNLQYALLFSKHWSYGHKRKLYIETDFNAPEDNELNLDDYRFHYGADHRLLQNVNLDFGMQYRWESSYANLIFNLAAGYRVYAYWNMYDLFTSPASVGNANEETLIVSFIRDETMIYAGPYIRFSLAY